MSVSRRLNGEGSIQRLKGRSGYRAQVSLANGTRPTKQCRTIEEARKWIREQIRAEDRGETGNGKVLTLKAWANQWFITREHKVAPNTLRNEKNEFRLYFGPIENIRLDKLTPGRIDDWLAQIHIKRTGGHARTTSPHTLRMCYSLLSVMLRDAQSHRLIGISPIDGVKRPKVPIAQPKFIASDDLTRVLDLVDESGDPRAIAVHLMVRLGLRRNEALGLLWDDLDLDESFVTVRYQLGRVAVKGVPTLVRRELKTLTSRRRLRVTGDLAIMLDDLRKSSVSCKPIDFIVSLGDGLPVDPDAVSHWLSGLGQTIGVQVSPHRLRHSAATLMLNNGVGIETVGKVLGHADVRTTSVYARVLDSSSDDALTTLAKNLDATSDECLLKS